jgi:biotin transport system substrate-specific component
MDRLPETGAAIRSARWSLAQELAAATAAAALTGLGARVQLHLPFTPVPVTGQVFCVLLAGAVLGPRLGFVSQVEYLAAGMAGLPVFAFGGGPAAALGPTGGYLVGFPVAAAVVGALCGRQRRAPWWRTAAACLAGVPAIYLCGAAWYAVWLADKGAHAGVMESLAQSVAPFAAVDAGKAAAVAIIAPALRHRLLPR